MKIATFELEKELLAQGYSLAIGTDEVGRGPLAGPVVAAAVTLRNFQLPPSIFQANPSDKIFNDPMWELVRDSKSLSEKQREKVFGFICEHFHVGTGLCNQETIDRINILEASFLAMKKAVQDLLRNIRKECHPERGEGVRDFSAAPQNDKVIVLVDGNKKIPNFSFEQKAVVGGDGTVKSIAAASIVAKVMRDRLMKEYASRYPQYGFEKHMGYGTKQHMDALGEHGPCEIHRKSFAPVKKALDKATLAKTNVSC